MQNTKKLENEYKELADKFEELKGIFSNEEEFNKLTTIEKNLMSNQATLMQQLLNIYEMRLELSSYRESKNGKK